MIDLAIFTALAITVPVTLAAIRARLHPLPERADFRRRRSSSAAALRVLNDRQNPCRVTMCPRALAMQRMADSHSFGHPLALPSSPRDLPVPLEQWLADTTPRLPTDGGVH